MLTITLVNRDMNPDGTVAKHFLVKRLIAQPGEQIRMRDGRVEINERDGAGWTAEDALRRQYLPLDYTIQKKFYPFDEYADIKENVLQQVYLQGGVTPEPPQARIDSEYVVLVCGPRVPEALSVEHPDTFEYYYFQMVLEEFGKYNHATESWPFDKIKTEYQKLMLSLFDRRDLDLSKLSDADVSLQYQKLVLAYNRVPRSRIDALSKDEVAAAFQSAAVKYLYTYTVKPDSRLYTDMYFEDYWINRGQCSLKPYDAVARDRFERRALGWYIPPDRFFPMGDNRDNSLDARYFGAVKTSSLLGKSLFRFWPLNRLGAVN